MIRPIRPCALLALSALLSACGSERAVAPTVEQAPSGFMADIIVEDVDEDRESAQFIVTPSGGVFTLGRHSIYFPPNVICDPNRSSYRPGDWDAPCRVSRRPVRIHATIVEDSDQSAIRFSPDLRFAPSADESRWVWLFMRIPRRGRMSDPSQYRILWSPGGNHPAVDESLTDPTLRTFFSRRDQLVYRRIKHFSGYQVSDGRATRGPRGDSDD